MQTSFKPIFIEASEGRLFAIYHAPLRTTPPTEALIYIPPFAEEMNRSRRMASLQAQAFAAQGYGVLLLDLLGTGESDGDFVDARWQTWLENVSSAAQWLEASGHTKINLWGLRLGALLACYAAASQPDRFGRLLLWQPVSDGKTMMTQFLRVRIAASLGDRKSETTDTLRGVLASGTSIEVAGYELSPDLVAALDRSRLSEAEIPPSIGVHWLEISRAESEVLSPAVQRIVEAWRQKAISVSAETVAGLPFWNIQETAVAPALIASSVRLMSAHPNGLISPA